MAVRHRQHVMYIRPRRQMSRLLRVFYRLVGLKKGSLHHVGVVAVRICWIWT